MSGSVDIYANCPGCVIDLPTGMPDDTIFLGPIPNGTTNQYYDQDVSFRMPMSTDPVNETNPDIPAGLSIIEIKIINVSNLPPGLAYEANQTVYDPQVETDGCFKFCGTPLVPGLYTIDVTVEATVFVLTEEVTFPMQILIEPASSTNDGFSMLNNSGCGEVTTSFENNILSNGNDGFSYHWDFGNGNTSIDENPSDQTYTEPGTYIVNYEAIIDTFGYILTRVSVEDVACFDIPTAPDFSNNPDLHVEITDPNGMIIFESETIWNTDPPIEVFPNINMEEGVYHMRVIDEDSGINGADDICAEINFNFLSNGTISGTDFELVLDIFHPMDTVNTSDTITVFPIPDAPSISNSGSDQFCAGETVVLSSSYDENNQWFFDGVSIAGETENTFEVFESGIYTVQYTSADGCSAVSEEIEITIFENPATPQYTNENNLLSLLTSIVYDSEFTFQWYESGVELIGETQTEYCAMEDGDYTLEVTDPASGCISIFTSSVVYNGSLDCFTDTEDLANEIDLKIFPNPVANWINVSLNIPEATTVEVRFYDMLGRLHSNEVLTSQVNGITQLQPIAVDRLPAGMHFIELRIGEETIVRKFVKN